MNRTFRVARWSGAALAVLCAAPLWALGLGDIDVESHLNEPLVAKVPIIGADRGTEVEIQIGDAAAYQRLGLTRPRLLEGVEALVEVEGTGQVVRLRGRAPVTELILDLVLILQADGARQIRHYPVLLDFPTAVAQAPSVPPSRRLREPASLERPPTAPAATATGKTYGPVQPGETLGGIATLIRGDQPVRYWALVEALFELNPEAFIDNDIDRLKVGVVLRIPALEGLSAPSIGRAPVSPGTPVARLTAPRGDATSLQPDPRPRAADRSRDSRLEIIGTPNSAEILDSMNDLLQQDDVALATRGQEARRQLAFATAEIETYRAENEQLRRQVGDLEDRVGALNRLIELRAREPAVELPPAEPPSPVGGSATGGASVPAAATTAEPSEALVTLPGDRPGDRVDRRPLSVPWLALAAALALLVAVAALLWLRTRRETQRRQERTADLVNRIRQAAERQSTSA